LNQDSKSRAAKNILVTGLAQAWRLAASFGLTVFSTRNLSPADFGLLAMVATATGFLNLVKDLGIGQVIIQRQDITKDQLSALFWLSVLSSLLFGVVLVVAAYPISLFFDEPKLQALTLAFAGLFLLGGLATVPSALLNKLSEFKRLAILDIATTSASFLAGVFAVLVWKNYWALYFSAFVSTVVSIAGIWVWSGYRPGRPHIDRATFHLAKFGFHVSGFNLVNYFSRNADNILIGKFWGGDVLGLYDRAYRLLLFPITQLHTPIGQVIVPLLSRVQNDKEKYLSIYSDTISLIMFASQPGIIFAILFSEPLFRFVLGEHWVEAAPIFWWLGVAAINQVMTATAGWVFMSQGRGREFFMLGIWGAVVNVTSFLVGLPWGAVGVAASYTITNYVVMVPLVWISMGRNGSVSTKNLIDTSGPHWIACAAAVIVVRFLAMKLASPDTLAGMTISLALSYASYTAVLLIFSAKRELGKRLLAYATLALRGSQPVVSTASGASER
jgi:PST family polysaccharide transporter